MENGFIKLNKAAKYLGIPPRTLRLWISRGIIRCYRPTQRTLLFKIGDLAKDIERFKT